MIDTALRIALDVHGGSVDKGGSAYILHPLRLMFQFPKEEENLRCIALLHDTVEDSEGRWTAEKLREEGFSARVVDAVVALSKQEGESYISFVKRCAQNQDALRVKMADLEDNMTITRLSTVNKEDLQRLEKYHQAYMYLKERREED